MDKWTPLILGILATVTSGGVLAYLFVPPKTRFESVEKRIEKLELEVTNLRVSNRASLMGITALRMHSDMLAERIEEIDDTADIERADSVLARVAANIKAMDDAGIPI